MKMSLFYILDFILEKNYLFSTKGDNREYFAKAEFSPNPRLGQEICEIVI